MKIMIRRIGATCALLLLLSLAKAQNVLIPDTAFGRWIKNYYLPSCMSGNSTTGWYFDTICYRSATPLLTSLRPFGNVKSLEGLQYFRHVKTLDIHYLDSLDHITAFPDSTSVLTLGNPKLHSIPPIPNTLTTLLMFKNGLSSFPVLPATTSEVQLYDAIFTPFPTLPNTLRSLYLLYTSPVTVPSFPDSLRFLYITYDGITGPLPALPTYLKSFWCFNTNLTSLPALPSHLDSLDCHNNKLLSLPALPPSLYYLWCAGNPHLTSLPAIPDSMAWLDCTDDSALTCMPLLHRVEYLNFWGTNITCLPSYPTGNWAMGPPASSIPLCAPGNPNGCLVAYGAAGPDRATCPYGAIQPSATGTGTWTALSSNPLTTSIANPTSPITVISGFSVSGTYGYVWTVSGVPDTMYVTVNPKPNAGADVNLPCISLPGGSALLVGSGTGAWSAWSMNADTATITSPGGPTTTITGFPSGGTYLYIWTSSLGCSDTVGVNVSEAAPTPVLTSLGSCLPTDTLRISGAHTALVYTWYLNGNPIDVHHFPAFTIAGGNGAGNAGNQLYTTTDIHRDAGGNLYVLDRDNNRVQKFPAGSTSATNGVTIAGGNGQGGAANQMVEPEGMFVTATGDIYIADTYMNRIQKFPAGSTSSTNATTVAGGNGPGSTANKLNTPYGVYVDSAGNLYVADKGNHRIQRFPVGSTSATNGVTVAGTGTSGSGATQLSYPFGITVNGDGSMYVSDAGNHRIQKFPSGSTSGISATTVAGGNGQGSSANQLNYPHNVFVNTNGDLYVADMSNARIQRFPAGSTSATNGVTVAGGNGQDTATNQLSSPTRVIRDAAGYLYIADQFNNRVQEWTAPQMDSLFVPTSPGTYTATSTMYSGCISPVSNSIVLNYCLTDSVWPGDADHNGVADNNDLLPIGTGYGLNGVARTNQSIVWSAHYAQDWGLQFLSGENAKHADCNGDGVIDANDTTAILQNFGLTHFKTNGYGAPWRSGIPGITLRYSKDTVQAGDTLIVSLILGDSITTVSGLYGLAFTYHFDPLVVDTTSCTFGFTNSFIGNSSNKISIHKDFRTDGEIKAAVTGINHTNRSGYGEIARFIGNITTGNINGKDLAYYGNINYITDINAVDKDGNLLQLNAGTDSNEVAYEPSGLHDIDYERVIIYPNPASDAVTIQTTTAMIGKAYSLSDVAGRILLGGAIRSTSTRVSIADLASGIYILQLGDQSYKLTKK